MFLRKGIKGGYCRVFSALLAAVMLLSFAIPAFASAKKAPITDERIGTQGDERPETLSRGAQPLSAAMLRRIENVKAPAVTIDFSSIRILITLGNTTYIHLDLCCDYLLGDSAVISASVDSPRLIKVAVSSGTVTVTDRDSGEVLASGDQVTLKRLIQNYEAGWAQLTRCANEDTSMRYYLGDFLFYSDSGYVRMVNTVPMAYYLYGIVGYELSPSCYPEALKAQAVAAKVFGMYFMKTSATAKYDVEDGWKSRLYQAYRGFRENRLSTMQYCLDVIGVAFAYNGTKLFPAFYGATDGGETALPSQIFGAYESQFDCGFENWLDDIEFDNYSSYKQLIKVTFGGKGDSTRFLDFILGKINDENGTNAFSVVSIDDLYTYAPLEGTARDMKMLHVGATVKQTVVDEATGETVEETASYVIDCETKQLRSYKLTDIDGSGDDYSSYKYVFTKNYGLYWGKKTTNGYTLIFSRYGNGIGFSQIGANVRANPKTFAMTYMEILSFYYPNFTFITINEKGPDEFESPVPYEPVIAAYGVCSLNGTNFRTGPSTSYSIIGVVNSNEHIDILDVTSTGWFHAIWNGHVGYISATRSRAVMFPSPKNGVFTLIDGTTTGNVNLRWAPYISDDTYLATLKKGTKVTAWAHIGIWYYVTTEDGMKGFLSSTVTNYDVPYQYLGAASLLVETPTLNYSRMYTGEGLPDVGSLAKKVPNN